MEFVHNKINDGTWSKHMPWQYNSTAFAPSLNYASNYLNISFCTATSTDSTVNWNYIIIIT